MKGRVLYVIGSLDVGGAERHVTQVSIKLKERGWEPEFFVLSMGGPLTENLKSCGIPIYGVRLPTWIEKLVSNARLRARLTLLLTSIVLIKTIWLRRPAVLHFFLPAAYIIGGLVSLFAIVPARVMSRRSLNHYQSAHPISTKIELFLHSRMDMVCGNSLAVLRDLADEGVEEKRLRLIYNGIDMASFAGSFDRSKERIQKEIPERSFVFVLVANLIPYKGHADLIDALARIKSDLPENWLLLCLGRDDGIGASLKAQAETLGLNEHIRFLGSRRDVNDFLRLADVGLLCSHEEGFSNAILECMAAALPMVVTDVGGNAEAVVDGETGYVVPAHNQELLGQAILRVIRRGDIAGMGAKARQRAENLFSMDACVDGYEAMYREMGACPNDANVEIQ